jgi:integrase
VAEVAAEFIANQEEAGWSKIYLRDLRIRLGQQFATAFAMPMAALTGPLVQSYIYGLKNTRTGKPACGRTKGNMLRCVVSLANFARRRKYVPAELAEELSEIPAPKKEPVSIGIYTTHEITALLDAAPADLIPALAIAAFAGLRMSEVSRLDWRDIRLDERHIIVEPRKSKTGEGRQVPIADNLAAWLAPHARPFGPVNPATEDGSDVGNSLSNRLERLKARARVKGKRNGFRHSYVSYRVAILKDVPAVALECGNSPVVIFKSYRKLVNEAQGRAWFAVAPTKAASNVIPLPAAAA